MASDTNQGAKLSFLQYSDGGPLFGGVCLSELPTRGRTADFPGCRLSKVGTARSAFAYLRLVGKHPDPKDQLSGDIHALNRLAPSVSWRALGQDGHPQP